MDNVQAVERLFPQDIEAEQGVLGSLIIDPDALSEVEGFLFPEDFYRDAHRTLYAMILRLAGQHSPADFIILCNALERAEMLEDVGGASYITSLVNRVPTSANVVHYAHIVENMALLRRVIHAGTQMVGDSYQRGDAQMVVERAEQLVYGLSRRQSASDFQSDSELVLAYVDKLFNLQQAESQLLGVPTGFHLLDFLLGGFQRSDLIVPAGRPRTGKSSFMLSAARNIVQNGGRVGIFSLEMSKEQLTQRLLAMTASIDLLRLRNGQVMDHEWVRITDAMELLSTGLLWIDDTPGLTPAAMYSKLRRLTREGPLDVVFIDYLQLMRASPGESRPENRVLEIGEITRALKGMAKELNVPVVALAQLSRAVEARQVKIPQLSDLRESGSIENDADVVLFIYRDEVYNMESSRGGIADIIIAKHRNGPEGEVQLSFHGPTTNFGNLPPERKQPSLSTLYNNHAS
jgi:replicative DNA helicase